MNDTGSENESTSTAGCNGSTRTTVQNAINSHVQREYRVEIVKDMAIEKMKQKMHDIVDRIGKDVEKEMEFAVDDLVTEVKQFNVKTYELQQLYNGKSSNGTDTQRQNSTLNGKLPKKVFRARNSLLTDMMETNHIKTIYHIFIVMLIILFLNTVVHDFVDTGSINLGLRPIVAGFGKFHIAVMLWCCMQTSTFLLYPCFRRWARKRKSFTPGSAGQKLYDWTAILLFFLYQWAFFLAAIASHVWYDLPPATGVAYLMEMVRFLMKTHAFIRSNVPKALTSDTNEADFESIHVATSCGIPPFSKYLYFMVAPTLVYRDEYPRTRNIRWRVVTRHALELVGTVFFISFILERLLTPLYENFGTAQISSGRFVESLFCSFLPAMLFYLCFFYCSLHVSMNITAELTRFADRMFYRDWWNESTFAGYIRSWNVVVYDWLYTYLYKDFVEYVFCNCRLLAMLAVITVSAVFHEIILAFTFRFFYPVMFVQFEMALLVLFATKQMGKEVGKFLFWLVLTIGNGFLFSLYIMEFYARRNCPDVGNSIVDYLVPVSWFCNGISNNPNWTITAPWNLP